MLARPKRWYSRDWTIHSDDGRELILDLSSWKERAELELEGVVFRFQKQGAFSRDFSLNRGEELIASARKPSLARSRFEVVWGDRRLTVQRGSLLRRAFTVLENGTEIGGIRPRGVFTRRSDISLPDDWPLEVRLFVFWLVVVVWNRETTAAAAGGASS